MASALLASQRGAGPCAPAQKKAALAEAQRRITTIGQWADAIRKQQSATISPEAGEGTGGYRRARDAVAAYNAACH